VQLLERGEVELALISSNARPGTRGSLVAPLYPETLQIVVRKAAHVARIDDLAGKALSVGPSGSGTETIAWQVLTHFGLGRARVAAVNLTPLEAAARLEAGTLDAVFVVAGVRAPVVARLLGRGDMELLSLGDPDDRGGLLEGIRTDAPYLLTSYIPARAYGSAPAQRIGTVGVKALLVARKDLDPDLVYALAASLFAAKARLVEKEQLLAGLSEKFDPTESPLPLHPGADRYLRRDDPSLLEKYTDQISLALTIGALLWSAAAGLRAWRRQRQRGRIEVYFGRLAALTAQVRRGGVHDDVGALRGELETLELSALTDLGAERLEAGPAFRVLQEAVRALHGELSRR
jgi:TRAP transporter TAXI family solute receptor